VAGLGSNQTVAGLKSYKIRQPLISLWRFKSDRCGIEIFYWLSVASELCWVQIRPLRDWNVYQSRLSKADAKVQIRPLRDWNVVTAKRIITFTSVQIRPLRDWNWDHGWVIIEIRTRSNQTVAGLKLHNYSPLKIKVGGSNQTVAGLKCCYRRSKSNTDQRSNQTVAGLKSNRSIGKWSASPSSNQTVAGLKLLQYTTIRSLCRRFKSDRCGIEMFLDCAHIHAHTPVQIRPLRDWNLVLEHRFLLQEYVQIRPLRDWNAEFIQLICVAYKVQIRPLRDWNTILEFVSTSVIQVQIRPLRDWNEKTKGFEHYKECVQIRPLRDWNITLSREDADRLGFKSDRCGIEICTRI